MAAKKPKNKVGKASAVFERLSDPKSFTGTQKKKTHKPGGSARDELAKALRSGPKPKKAAANKPSSDVKAVPRKFKVVPDAGAFRVQQVNPLASAAAARAQKAKHHKTESVDAATTLQQSVDELDDLIGSSSKPVAASAPVSSSPLGANSGPAAFSDILGLGGASSSASSSSSSSSSSSTQRAPPPQPTQRLPAAGKKAPPPPPARKPRAQSTIPPKADTKTVPGLVRSQTSGRGKLLKPNVVAKSAAPVTPQRRSPVSPLPQPAGHPHKAADSTAVSSHKTGGMVFPKLKHVAKKPADSSSATSSGTWMPPGMDLNRRRGSSHADLISQRSAEHPAPKPLSASPVPHGAMHLATTTATSPKGGGHLTFQDLLHQFPLVSRQVENGLYSLKRMAAYLKKIVAQEDVYVREVLKATSHETQKERVQNDGMKTLVRSWAGLQESMKAHAQHHQEFKQKVATQVMLPLQELHRAGEHRLKDILARMKQLQQRMKRAIIQVRKCKDKALSSLSNLKDGQDRDRGVAPQPRAVGGKVGGMFGKLAAKAMHAIQADTGTLKDKAIQACQNYQAAVDTANGEKIKFMTKEMPTIFKELYEMETGRLRTVREHMMRLATLYKELTQPLQNVQRSLATEVMKINCEADMQGFIYHWVQVHGAPPKQIPFRYDMPCTADELRQGRWNGSLELRVNRNTIFGVTLQDVMELQKKKHPNAQLPLIVTSLIDAIERLGGPKTEGIFRISAPKQEVDSLHRQFDKGVYEVKSDSPHVPAALLKSWFRELAEPLVPATLYQACVDSVKTEPIDSKKVVALYQSMPELNRRVVEALTKLIGKIVANSDTNRMNVSNLAIVFSPSFLRCESDDPMEMMTNSKYETKFVNVLFHALL